MQNATSWTEQFSLLESNWLENIDQKNLIIELKKKRQQIFLV